MLIIWMVDANANFRIGDYSQRVRCPIRTRLQAHLNDQRLSIVRWVHAHKPLETLLMFKIITRDSHINTYQAHPFTMHTGSGLSK